MGTSWPGDSRNASLQHAAPRAARGAEHRESPQGIGMTLTRMMAIVALIATTSLALHGGKRSTWAPGASISSGTA